MSKLSKTVHYVQPNPQSSHYRNEHQPMEKVVRWHEQCLYDCSHKPERLAGNLRRSDAAGLGKGTRSRDSSTERIQTRKQNLTASNFHGLEKGAKNRGTTSTTEWIQTRKQRLTASNFHGLEKGAKHQGTITEWIQTRKQRLTLTASKFSQDTQ